MRLPTPTQIVYPSSDGKPMAENTRQGEYIAMIEGNLEALEPDRTDVFVAMDNFWYPVEGHPEIVIAPDVYVVFGRPNYHRPSYKQWEEENIPPHVAFEILSPSNRGGEMAKKFAFYQRYGVEEYYTYDPDDGELRGWLHTGESLVEVPQMVGYVSPRLGIRFELDGIDLKLFRPDGEPFLTYVQMYKRMTASSQASELNAKLAREDRLARQQAQRRADTERALADAERTRADAERNRADTERNRADAERNRADDLAAKLLALGVDPKSI